MHVSLPRSTKTPSDFFFVTRVGAGCHSVVNDFVLVNDVKRRNFCQEISFWAREIDFDPGSVGEIKRILGQFIRRESPAANSCDLSRRSIKSFSKLTFKDQNIFIAGRLHTCIEEWEKTDTPDFVLKWLKQGVGIVSMFKHFKRYLKGNSYYSDIPPTAYFSNASICKNYTVFIFTTLFEKSSVMFLFTFM